MAPKLTPPSSGMPQRQVLYRNAKGETPLRLDPDLNVRFPNKSALRQPAPWGGLQMSPRRIGSVLSTAIAAAILWGVFFTPATEMEPSFEPRFVAPVSHTLPAVEILVPTVRTTESALAKASTVTPEAVRPVLLRPPKTVQPPAAAIRLVTHEVARTDVDQAKRTLLTAWVLEQAIAKHSPPAPSTESTEVFVESPLEFLGQPKRIRRSQFQEKTRAGRLLFAAWSDVAFAIHKKSRGRIGAGWVVNQNAIDLAYLDDRK